MKKITCELCGSNDFVKEDGMFVCQSCGTKYSVEEARKLMIEGTVEVKGSVQIDRSKEIENKIQNAVREYNINNVDRAISLCMDVLNEDPENFEAIIYKALSDGWKADLQNTRLDMVISEVQRALGLLRKQESDNYVYSEKAAVALREVGKFSKAISDMFEEKKNAASKRLDQMNKEADRLTQRLNAGDRSALYEANRLMSELSSLRTEPMTLLIQEALPRKQAVDFCAGVITDIPVKDMSESMIEALRFYDKDLFSKMDQNAETGKRIQACIAQYEQIKNEEQKQKRAEYWASHPDEKAKLDHTIELCDQETKRLNDEIKDKEAEIRKINDTIDKTPLQATKKQEEIRDQVKKLQAEKNGLGLFKMKEKKAIEEKISRIQGTFPTMMDIKQEKNEIRKQYQPQFDEINQAIEELKTKIAEQQSIKDKANEELNRNR